ncbi:MAG: M1 family aminopeptidase [Flavobacterium sp.]|jgi:aminopeptidase N|nr:M1 family aminopeptidase [Flavobacterium sp.]
MKNIIVAFLFFCFVSTNGQESISEICKIAKSEMKSAERLMNLLVNPNTQNYDVTYHKLEFTVDPAICFITGQVTTTYTALENMSSITFDMANELTVTSVTKNGMPLTFSESGNNELIITLPSLQQIGTSASVKINYSGVPPVNGFTSFSSETHNGTPVLWTLSEPYGARDWWPCKQDLNDKISSIDVYITAPSQYISASNGVEPEAPVTIGSQKTTHFRHNYPIPAYLIAIAVTNYQVFTQQAGISPNNFPIVNYLYPESYATSVFLLAQTLPIMNLFETLFETYPFHNEKYGHAQFGWGGGMEHTTVSFMGDFNRSLIAHELAHQWFGDKITCGTWKDIWLNEGFATYLASLVIENFDGQAAFIADKSNMINNITSSLNGAVYLTDAQALDANRIFSGRLSYNKGAMVLHMLRFKLGDAIFFQGIKNYLADVNLAYKYAITSNLQTHLEAVYGSSLTEFFNDWVYNQGYPIYNITVQNTTAGQARITVAQTTSHNSVPFFEMPVPVRLLGASGQSQDVVVNNTVNGEQFNITVPFTVTGVQFDPNKNIISRMSTVTLENANFDFDTAIQIYPNPSSTTISISIPENIEIENAYIYTVLGQKIMETKSQKTWDITSFSSGIHFLTIQTNKGTKQFKFVKE